MLSLTRRARSLAIQRTAIAVTQRTIPTLPNAIPATRKSDFGLFINFRISSVKHYAR